MSGGDLSIFCALFFKETEKRKQRKNLIKPFHPIVNILLPFFGYFNQLLLLNIPKERCKETYQQLVSCERENLGLKNSEGKFFC